MAASGVGHFVAERSTQAALSIGTAPVASYISKNPQRMQTYGISDC